MNVATRLTPDEFSDEQSLIHIKIVESIQVLVLAVVLLISPSS